MCAASSGPLGQDADAALRPVGAEHVAPEPCLMEARLHDGCRVRAREHARHRRRVHVRYLPARRPEIEPDLARGIVKRLCGVPHNCKNWMFYGGDTHTIVRRAPGCAHTVKLKESEWVTFTPTCTMPAPARNE